MKAVKTDIELSSHVINQTLLGVLSGFQPPVVPPAVLQCKDGMVQVWCSLHPRSHSKIFLLWNGLFCYNTSFILKWPNYWNASHRKWKLNLKLEGLSQDKQSKASLQCAYISWFALANWTIWKSHSTRFQWYIHRKIKAKQTDYLHKWLGQLDN